MNVLFVSDSTTLSGAEIVMLGCMDGLVADGQRPYAFVRASNHRLIEALRGRSIPFAATHAFSQAVIRTTANPAALFEFARSFVNVRREMAEFIVRHRIDVVHSISYPASLYAALAGRLTGTRQIWHEHNIKRIHRANRLIYQAVASTCHSIVGPSSAVTDRLATSGIAPAKLRTVYNGIDLRRFSAPPQETVGRVRAGLGVGEGETAVGLFGQMLPYKGHGTLIDAAPNILARHPGVRFFLVGALENPPYQRQLNDRLSASGFADRFCFTGWRDNVHEIVGAMHVVVVATTTPEPAALLLMEAMAAGRPVVATRTGGTPEIVVHGETGLLFEPADAAGLAAHVVTLLDHPDMAAAFGARGRERVQREFGRERHLAAMADLYTQAAAARGQGKTADV